MLDKLLHELVAKERITWEDITVSIRVYYDTADGEYYVIIRSGGLQVDASYYITDLQGALRKGRESALETLKEMMGQ